MFTHFLDSGAKTSIMEDVVNYSDLDMDNFEHGVTGCNLMMLLDYRQAQFILPTHTSDDGKPTDDLTFTHFISDKPSTL